MKRSRVIITAILIAFTTIISKAQVGVGVSVSIGPPAIPVYEQPPCPVDGYLWVPGYWAWDPDDADYYWVPGYWMDPPEVGFLWTPGYWGFVDGAYMWHYGYWGPHIGFYGGVCYGFGYYGHGFYGGRWEGGHFMYNSAAWHVNNTVIHNTYVERGNFNHPSGASFNGRGGVTAAPNHDEQVAMNEHHSGPTSNQSSHERTMSQDKNQFSKANHGNPGVTAMDKPGGQRFNSGGKEATATHNETPAAKNSHIEAPVHNGAPAHTSAPAHHTAPAQQNHPADHNPQSVNHMPAAQPKPSAPQHSAPQQHMNRQPEAHQQPRQQAPQQHMSQPPRQQAPRQAPPQQHMSQPPRQQAPRQAPPQQHREGGGGERR